MALAFLHERLMRHRSDREQLTISAEMGMPGAQEKLDAYWEAQEAAFEEAFG